MTRAAGTTADARWRSANGSFLQAEMDRLRLRLQRRVLWLRQRWQKDAATERVNWAITDQEVDALLDSEHRQEEIEFYESDAVSREIHARLDQVDAHLDALRRDVEEAGTRPAIDLLATRFQLNAFERDVLLLCLGPELDLRFERIYAYVQDDAARRFATPHLALTVLATHPRDTERASFAPGAPLRRWRLLTLDVTAPGSLLSSPLRVDERIRDFLSGVNELDPRFSGLLVRAPDVPLASCHRDLAAVLARQVNGAGTRRSSVINLVGSSDSGRLALARAGCEHAGLGLLIIAPRLLPAPGPERRESIALVDREAALLGSALYLDVDGLNDDDTQLVVAALDTITGPLLIASKERLSSDRAVIPIRIRRPDPASQAELWSAVLGESAEGLRSDIATIVEQFDLGPSGIAGAAAIAVAQASLRTADAPVVTAGDLWRACRQQSGPQIEHLARRIEPCFGWDDIVVPRDVRRQLCEITTQVANRPQVYQDWGFGKKLSRGRGISALFSGASGVGKTMAAEILAGHLSLDLYRIDLAGVVSKYIGETEKNLRRVFDAAERSGAILFFDEADALFGKRSEVKDSHDRYANIEINYLLQRMEDYRGLAILATNMRSTMDAAFLRRLRFIVDFPFPDGVHRMEIWRRVFPPEAPLVDLDFAALSRLEIPGGNIRNIAVNAAFLAAADGAAITMEHVMGAARREYTKIDRLIRDTEFGRFSGAVAS
jgi:AAA+ superfamily predicted ATPase